MASSGNQHCANCIGALSFLLRREPERLLPALRSFEQSFSDEVRNSYSRVTSGFTRRLALTERQRDVTERWRLNLLL